MCVCVCVFYCLIVLPMGSRSLGEAMEVISPDAVLLVRAPCKKERLELFNEDEHMLGSYSHRKGGLWIASPSGPDAGARLSTRGPPSSPDGLAIQQHAGRPRQIFTQRLREVWLTSRIKLAQQAVARRQLLCACRLVSVTLFTSLQHPTRLQDVFVCGLCVLPGSGEVRVAGPCVRVVRVSCCDDHATLRRPLACVEGACSYAHTMVFKSRLVDGTRYRRNRLTPATRPRPPTAPSASTAAPNQPPPTSSPVPARAQLTTSATGSRNTP